MNDDDGPVLGADPDRVRTAPSAGTKVTQFARYFEAAWDKVEPTRRTKELNWPQKPWPIGKKTAFMAWVKQVLLPGYRDNLPLLFAMVDEFCINHAVHFSPYRDWAVWKQFNQHLDKLRSVALVRHPELQTTRVEADVDAEALARHRERQAKAEAKRKTIPADQSRLIN